jgi:phosphatidylglycerol:prolipoprotein diacylglycerol transferase
VHPVAFQIGDFTVYWYGILVAGGFLAGLWTASRRAPVSGVASEKVADIGPWLILGAILGARLFFVISYWREQFSGEPFWEVFMIRKGGLVFYGGLIGAALTHIIYCQVKRLPLWKMADVLAPSIALGYCFGRVGCLMNGCCFGKVCSLPWAIQFPVGHETHPETLHPTQLYEGGAGLLLYAALAWLYRHKKFDGQVFAAYLIASGTIRFGVEFLRGDYAEGVWGGWFTPAQPVALSLLAIGLVLWRLRHGEGGPARRRAER